MTKMECNDATDNGKKNVKALSLFSGGLDSILATKLILNQGIEVEAVHFRTPFCVCNCKMKFGEDLGIKLHMIFLGEEFLEIISDPTFGYGSQINPCLDCRIFMFKKSKELAEKIGADFLITGEVLDERPFSQRMNNMLMIEKKSCLEGKILRPLSAKLLPITEPERNGLVKRDDLLAIRGRRRLSQIQLAKKLGIKNYPSPAGGCLLTDPQLARRIKDHLKNEKRLTLNDVEILKIGRHFRSGDVKIVVGRNLKENERLIRIAKENKIPYLETIDYNGPITLYLGKKRKNLIIKAARITARYSDSPKNSLTKVIYVNNGKTNTIEIKSIEDKKLDKIRI